MSNTRAILLSFLILKLLLSLLLLLLLVRVSLVSWEGGSHALLFMVLLGLPSSRSMAQALRLPFEYYYY